MKKLIIKINGITSTTKAPEEGEEAFSLSSSDQAQWPFLA
jgi:hypothetical protein